MWLQTSNFTTISLVKLVLKLKCQSCHFKLVVSSFGENCDIKLAVIVLIFSNLSCGFDAEKGYSLCLNVFRVYVVLQIYLVVFWLMTWGKCVSLSVLLCLSYGVVLEVPFVMCCDISWLLLYFDAFVVWERRCSQSHYFILFFTKALMGNQWLKRPL